MSSANNQLTETCNYEIRTLTAEDHLSVFEFLKKFFYTSEPMTEARNRAGKRILDRLRPEDRPMVYLSEGLSFAAVVPSGEIIGVALNEEVKFKDFCTADSEEQIPKLLDYINAQITASAKLRDDEKEMDVTKIAIHTDWRNQKLGTKLLERSKKLAQEKGFKQIRSICSNAYTAKMFVSSGFECIYSLKYADCKKNGRLDFVPQEPHTEIKAMVLRF